MKGCHKQQHPLSSKILIKINKTVECNNILFVKLKFTKITRSKFLNTIKLAQHLIK